MEGETYLAVPVGIGGTLRRVLRLRCPRCGRGALFTGWFAMLERCSACRLRFEREQGYFVGAIYVNYAVTAVACLGTAIAADVVLGVPLSAQLAIAFTLGLLVPVVFFRYSRALWLGIAYWLTTADEQAERRRPRR